MTAYPRNAKPHGGYRGANRSHQSGPGWQGHSTPAGARLLLSRLEGVKRAGKGWRARCPAHGSGSDSLSVVESDSGRVLVRCHAQCTAAAIVAAVGLRLSDLCPARERGRPDPLVYAQAAALAASAKRKREAEEVARQQSAARAASARWEAATPADAGHPYLRAKRVEAHGIRQSDGLLLVPMRDGDGVLWGVQSIAGDGAKRFQPGARKRGLWHLLGGPVVDGLCIAEGYATAASIHAAVGGPVAVAFDAGNLLPVARALRALHPSARIVVCADDDAATAARLGRNPGIEAAEAAARAVGGSVARPVFGGAR
jgi:putative DNA primase/helicase